VADTERAMRKVTVRQRLDPVEVLRKMAACAPGERQHDGVADSASGVFNGVTARGGLPVRLAANLRRQSRPPVHAHGVAGKRGGLTLARLVPAGTRQHMARFAQEHTVVGRPFTEASRLAMAGVARRAGQAFALAHDPTADDAVRPAPPSLQAYLEIEQPGV
jgi:hypothetical protein